jgi:uncharacterized repeat protein (TIGR03803 family)
LPAAALLKHDQAFLGTATSGGSLGGGVVYRLAADGRVRVLHSFDYNGGQNGDGSTPASALINVGGTYYGTTTNGGEGPSGLGTVFSLTPQGVETVLHTFGQPGDGAFPSSALVNVGGTLYGTTPNGGASNIWGTVFSITSQGTYAVLYSFAGKPDGGVPLGNLIDVDGTLYGTTKVGGAHNDGTVFKITPDGIETVLYSFDDKRDGGFPEAGLLRVGRTLYGTTYDLPSRMGRHGTAFAMTLDGKETVLYSFKGHNDGSGPRSTLINVGGVLYGTTAFGGPADGGTVFSVSP